MEDTCKIKDCGRAIDARGWCRGHYQRWRKYGDPLAGGPIKQPPSIPPPCAVETCSRSAHTRGLCPTHYQRLRQHGDVMADREIGYLSHRSLRERFWRYVDICGPNACHLWTGARNGNGYGVIADDDGRQLIAHRAAYKLAYGAVPTGMEVCHRCDNPPCVNVRHLFLGTRTDNVRDMYAKGRARHAAGAANKGGAGKLTLDNVRAIRRSRISTVLLAEFYSVSRTAIERARTGKTWHFA